MNKGNQYEATIVERMKNLRITPSDFIRGGGGSGPDGLFIHRGKSYNLEIKNNIIGPDYGQKKLVWDVQNGWQWSVQDNVTKLYNHCGVLSRIQNRSQQENYQPRRYTVIPKEQITQTDKKFDQKFFEDKFDIPYEALVEYYKRRDTFYIQIGNNYGLYRIGEENPAKLPIPKLQCDFMIRMRAKTHHSKPVHKYSFFAVLKAKTTKVTPSPYNIETSNITTLIVP